MQTLSEFLNIEENQMVVLDKIIGALRERGEWGKYGLFSKIAEPIGFSASYVSKSLMGKKPLRENFVEKMAEYLGVSVAWLRGESKWCYQDECDREILLRKFFNEINEEIDEDGEWDSFIDEHWDEFHKYRNLGNEFYRLPIDKMDQAIKTLVAIKKVKERHIQEAWKGDNEDEITFNQWLDGR